MKKYVPTGNEMISLPQDKQIVECLVEDEDIATVYVGDEGYYFIVYSSKKMGTIYIHVTDNEGNLYDYQVTSKANDFIVEEIE